MDGWRETERKKWGNGVSEREREREICPCLDTLLGREEEGGKEREKREKEMGRQTRMVTHTRLILCKGGQQGSCIFNSCIEKGISAGLIGIDGEPGEIPSSAQHLKLQE